MATAYLGGRWIERAKDRANAGAIPLRPSPRCSCRSRSSNIPTLFTATCSARFRIDHGFLNLPLPLGISFVSFTLTAYLVDIYRESFSPDHRPKTVLAYVLFFPHLIAGPILRPHELVPQLENPRAATLRGFAVPLAIFTLGLVKKLIFADQLSPMVTATMLRMPRAVRWRRCSRS